MNLNLSCLVTWPQLIEIELMITGTTVNLSLDLSLYESSSPYLIITLSTVHRLMKAQKKRGYNNGARDG